MLIIESFRNFANSTYNREGAYNRVTRVMYVAQLHLAGLMSPRSLRVTKNAYFSLLANSTYQETFVSDIL